MPSGRPLLPYTVFIIFCLSLLKFYHLGIRPPHHDESVNGWFVDGMMKTGYYHYDPQNYHGPLYFYILALFQKIFGRSLESLRAVTVVFGALLTFIPFLYQRWIGKKAAVISALLLAVSPAVVFFSRYAIHEVPFAFALALFFYFWLRAREEPYSKKILIALSISLAVMASLKENFIIFIGCILIAEVMIRIYKREFTFIKKYFQYFIAIPFALLLIAILFTAFGFDREGLPNFFKAFQFWTETGSKGNGHEKPWNYWLDIMKSYEWATLLGVVLSPLVLIKKIAQPVRLLAVVSIGSMLAYTLVQYKTPWCILSFQWGFVLFTGYSLSKLWEYQSWGKWIALFAVAALSGHAAIHAYSISYVNVDADNSFYIYGQTYREFMPPVNEILKKGGQVQIISQYTWPLPYLLGELKNVGYFTELNAPEKLEADFVLIDLALEQKYLPRLKGNYQRAQYNARQWASPMVIFTRY